MSDRYRGVFLGVAVGNLLGLPVEGMDRTSVRELFPGGVREIEPKEKLLDLPWDDDVAQTVLLAEALLASDVLRLEDLASRFVRWGRENGRGMGNLTQRVLRELANGTPATEAARQVWEMDGRQPAGNGAVMRCSPVALKWRRQPRLLVEETLRSAQVTHYDLRCQWSAVAVNIALAHALEGQVIRLSALASALGEVGVPDTVVKAARFAEDRSLDELVLDERHAMGYTLKAMQAGLWALTQGGDFEEALIKIVNAGGDTDTNGAVAGAVLGALHGEGAIPARWLSCVPRRERLVELADQLFAASESLTGAPEL
jgi:ADP-ribosyl-[dinitrogen reductase] hydrolase